MENKNIKTLHELISKNNNSYHLHVYLHVNNKNMYDVILEAINLVKKHYATDDNCSGSSIHVKGSEEVKQKAWDILNEYMPCVF